MTERKRGFRNGYVRPICSTAEPSQKRRRNAKRGGGGGGEGGENGIR